MNCLFICITIVLVVFIFCLFMYLTELRTSATEDFCKDICEQIKEICEQIKEIKRIID